jgi:hypothetical protein
LQKLGASEPIVVSEMKKLQVLQAIASKNFRQDLVQKLRRQKNKASYIKDKFGLGPGSTVSTTTHPPKLDKIGKSKSVALPSPVKEESILGKILFLLKFIHLKSTFICSNEDGAKQCFKNPRHDYKNRKGFCFF